MAGDYPLHEAAYLGNYDEVCFLLESVGNINELNQHNYTPLQCAVEAEETAIVKLLLKNGAYGDYASDNFSYPIHLAACLDHLEIMKLLIKEGVSINRPSDDYNLPLHRAAEKGCVHVVEYILDKCINVDITNEFDYTSLHFAAKYGNKEVVELLLRRNATSLPNYLNFYPLHLAAQNGHLEIVKLLLKRGDNLNEGNTSGWISLIRTFASGHLDVIQLLFESGSVKTRGIYDGLSYLHVAVEGDNIEAIKYFLEKGVDVNLATKNGYTALHAAAEYDKLHLVKYLLNKGADIDLKTQPKGFTALHFAARNCCQDILDFLIQNGANFIIKDNGECDILNIVSKRFHHQYSETETYPHKNTAKVIIKYIVLYNKNIQPNLPDYFPFEKKLSDFWHNCISEVEKMNKCFLRGTTISLYSFLRNIFNEHKLALCLFNKKILEEITNIEEYLKQFPLYANLGDFIATGIRKAMERQELLRKSDLILNHIIPQLPVETRCNILGYLTSNDLTNFIKFTKQAEYSHV